MSLAVNITLDDRQLQAALKRLLRAGHNLTDLFADIGEYLMPQHERRWEQNIQPDGQRWQPLKPQTLARKRTDKMLWEEGDLLRGPVYRPRSRSMQFGITDQKAPWHHYGTSRGLPSRELLGLSDADETEIHDIVRDYLLDTIKGR